ncbi:hypothetical protein ACFVFH_06675 [Streptomyces sp. NPDC057697]|uniref:hypothetical protein n=1 Tax=Streptomyces sp. NPDC057697 TaxID=3346219 RepID=UPI0036BF283D
MRRGVRIGLVAGWVVLAAGGWGLSQWMGEPSATRGPEPGSARPSWTKAEPGPQPESVCDDLVRAASPRPGATPAALLKASAAPLDSGTAHLRAVVCDRAEPAD